MAHNFSIGCDPEFFLQKDGRFVSAIPFVEGTKDEPFPLPNGGFVMRDNVAVEFGIPPAVTATMWVNTINKTLEDLITFLPEGLNIVAVPSTNFPRNELRHPEAKEFGCDPDFNAWSGQQNIPPEGCETSTFRSCGGHIHVGFIKRSGNDFLVDDYGKLRTIRMMDCFHGMFSTIMDNSEAAIARRKLYGKAGCYRPTDYGVEYRTLSNYWCRNDSLKRLMYYLTGDVLDAVRNNDDDYIVELLAGPEEIQRTINEGDDERAHINLSLLGEHLSNESWATYEEACNATKG